MRASQYRNGFRTMQLSDRIGRRIKLHDLHVLMAVVHAGSMGKAAAILNTTQPAVSRSIAELEHAIGVRLLDRDSKGVAPTQYGRALLNRGHAAFGELRQGVKDIEYLADPTAGEVRIGTTPPIAASFVSAVIHRLSQRFPRVIIHVVTETVEAQRRHLGERSLDLLIARNVSPIAEEQFNFEALYEIPFVVVAGTKNPWVRRRRIDLAELVHELWALPPADSSVGSVVAEAFRARGLEFPRATVVALAHEIRISLLMTGQYLTILPQSLLRFPAKHPFLKELPVKLPIAGGPMGIHTLKSRTLSPVAQLFIDCAREVAKPLAKRK